MSLLSKEIVNKIAKRLNKPLVIFDLETTGPDPMKDEVVQLAGIRINPDGSYKELEFTCKPSIPIEEGAAKVHGITNEMVATLPDFSKFALDISNLFRGVDVAGYNINRFDVRILDRMMEKSGYPDFFRESKIYDAYLVYAKHCSRKLADAVRYYANEVLEDAHDAMNDVVGTVKVIAGQLDKESGSVEEIANELTTPPERRVGVDNCIIIDDKGRAIINFGNKFKGEDIRKVDIGYLNWMLGGNFPFAVKEFIREHLKTRQDNDFRNHNRKR